MLDVKNLIMEYQLTGSEECFNELYAAYAPKVFRYARKQSFQRKLMWQDVESEANQTFYQAVKVYDTRIGDFEPFLFLMLRRRMMNISQRESTYDANIKRLAESGSEQIEDTIENSVIKKEQRQLLEDLIANATVSSRQALIAFAKSYSFREAAKQLGTTDKTVKNRILKIAEKRQNLWLADYLTA
ncbi:sigma-70 family RNA polymerase sigma factor [Jeotgalibacillus proteolyticus]|uniref:sigma-70 family RNA polymerase sigma factor n=1 Tax=Jeotgalibacillus proteolyticus TaxID=2082395 RepID=UPI003CEA7B99